MLHCVDAFPGPSCPKVDLLLSPKYLLPGTTQYGPPTFRVQGESLKGHGERGGWKTRKYVRMIVVLFSLLEGFKGRGSWRQVWGFEEFALKKRKWPIFRRGISWSLLRRSHAT